MIKLNSNISLIAIFISLLFYNQSSFACNRKDSCSISVRAEIKNVSCKGGSDGAIDLSITGKNLKSVSWSNGSKDEDISFIPSGSYSVTIKSDQCEVNKTFSVNGPDNSLSAKIIETKNITCAGWNDGMISVNASGGTPPYLFSSNDSIYFPSGEFFNLSSGTYNIFITDLNSCKTSISAQLPDLPYLTIDLGADRTIISGEETVLDAGEGFSKYLWTTGETTQKISVSNSVTETVQEEYMVEVTDQKGCKYSSNKVVISFTPGTQGVEINDLPDEDKFKEYPQDQ